MSKRPYRTEPVAALTLQGLKPAAIAARIGINAVRCAQTYARRTGRLRWTRTWRQLMADRQAQGSAG